jgi:hypothetical protein
MPKRDSKPSASEPPVRPPVATTRFSLSQDDLRLILDLLTHPNYQVYLRNPITGETKVIPRNLVTFASLKGSNLVQNEDAFLKASSFFGIFWALL